MTPGIDRFLEHLGQRLDKGASEYHNRSFGRSVLQAERELEEELIDLVGWTYVLWTQAAHKCGEEGKEVELRAKFFQNLRHRLIRNDRNQPEREPGSGAFTCMGDLEILAMDLFDQAQQIKRRLHPIARAIEVARWSGPVKGRRGGSCDPRSSD